VTLKILYVEDENDIRSIGTMAMEAIGGFTVKVCASGEEALKEASAFQPQLIVLDVMMPGMNGPETFRRLREIPAVAAVPVIFMTAKVQPSEIKEYMAMGALGVIVKPFDPMTVAAQIKALWESGRG
jgi:two-component system, OmpR family, response regulator